MAWIIIDTKLLRTQRNGLNLEWSVTGRKSSKRSQWARAYEADFVRELISSAWDVDKMDYLLRDSLYCGVRYGIYDLGRLADTFKLRVEIQKELFNWVWTTVEFMRKASYWPDTSCSLKYTSMMSGEPTTVY